MTYLITFQTTNKLGEEVLYISSHQVDYLVNEGDLITEIEGIVSIKVDNRYDTQYDFLSFQNNVIDSTSKLYPLVQGVCLVCGDGSCEVSFLLRDQKSESLYTSIEFESDSSVAEESVMFYFYLMYDYFKFELSHYTSELGSTEPFYFKRYLKRAHHLGRGNRGRQRVRIACG